VLGESLIVTDLVVPGEVGLVVAGACRRRQRHPRLDRDRRRHARGVPGDTAGYLVGRRFGTDVVTSRRWGRRLQPTLGRARRHFAAHGMATVAAAPWVGALRGVVPVVAGSTRVPAPRFFIPAVTSAAAWCTTIAFLGFVWGDDIADVVDRAGPLVSIVVVVAIVAVVMWNRRRRAHSTA
jgi:membrane-associated protein